MKNRIISKVLIVALLATSLLVVPKNSRAASYDNIFADFNNASSADEVLTQVDLSGNGVTFSPMTLVTEGADMGKGMKVALDNDGSRFCQSFNVANTEALAAAFKQSTEYKYLRLWINNPNQAAICIKIALLNSSNSRVVLTPSTTLTKCDGTTVSTFTYDNDGSKETKHIVVPREFAGWVAWPLELPENSNYDISSTTFLNLDVRPDNPASSTAYILDEIGLTTEAAGQLHDNFFADFNTASSAGEVLTQADLTQYDVTFSPMTLVTEGADMGKGMKVALDNDGSRYCQQFNVANTEALAAAFKQSTEYKYLRLWINNPNQAAICIKIALFNSSNSRVVLTPSTTLTKCDGTTVSTFTYDNDGSKETKHIVVPREFAGWVAWPLELPENSNYDISSTTFLNLDVRPDDPASSTAYILDEIGLTTEAAGQLKSDPNVPSLESKKQLLEEKINSYLNVTPVAVDHPSYNPDSDPNSEVNEWAGIKAITYDGATIGDKKTKVFAYIGFPSNASDTNKVPAVVLMHGGYGHAYAEWVQKWVDKGYAAIAIDNTGYFPTEEGKGKAGRETDKESYWAHGLTSYFEQEGYTNAPSNDAMSSAGGPIESQWMYHAVVQSILANNILRADNRVDNSKIGIVGISWGANISSISIGYDNRYAFAVPVYGAGYLDQSLSYMKDPFSVPEVKALWSAADRFNKVTFPVLWIGWANDPNFSIQSNSLSYMATRDSGSILSMLQNWGHNHTEGWKPEEIYRFADSVVKNGEPLLSCATLPGTTRNISFTIKKPSDASSVTAKAYYLTEKMSYSMNGTLSSMYPCTTIDQTWKTVDLTVTDNTVSGTLPSEAHSYYVELTLTTEGGKTYKVTTDYRELGLCGDVNSDENVDILDLVCLKKMVVSTETSVSNINSDMNCDGKLDDSDFCELRKALLK